MKEEKINLNKPDAELDTFLAEMLEDYTAKRALATGGIVSSLAMDMIADYRIRAKIAELKQESKSD